MSLFSVNTAPQAALAGQLDGALSSSDVKSLVNQNAAIAGVYDITITQADSTTYTFTVNGVPVSYTSAASGDTEADIVAGLILALQASSPASSLLAGTLYGSTVLRLTERDPTAAAVVVAESSASMAYAATVAHAAGSDIYPGRAIVHDTGADMAGMHPTAASQIFEGIAILGQGPAFNDRISGAAQYPAGSIVPVLHRGLIWVEVEEAVAPGDDVYFRHTASGANTRLGAFRNDSDSSSCDQVTTARWRKSSANGLALLSLNTP